MEGAARVRRGGTDPVSRREAGGLWEGGVGWRSPSSGARVKKQGVRQAGHGGEGMVQRRIQKDRSAHCRCQVFETCVTVTYTYGVPMVNLDARECQERPLPVVLSSW